LMVNASQMLLLIVFTASTLTRFIVFIVVLISLHLQLAPVLPSLNNIANSFQLKIRMSTSTTPADLIPQVTAYVRTYMSHFDGSHDFVHVTRVLGLAHAIHASLTDPSSLHYSTPTLDLDLDLITLGALLHDVGDRKYLQPGQDASTLVLHELLSMGTSQELAEKVQKLCTNVSWTNEMKDPAAVQALIDGEMPELAVVQDADRLDAIGAVGVGRVFTYGGARTRRGMRESVQVFEGKLYKIEGRMKTSVGKEMARVKTQRMRDFEELWEEELEVEGVGVNALREAGADVAVYDRGGFEETLGMEEQRMIWQEELKEELRKEVMAGLLPN
jgi:uncharacterized protein